MSFIWTVAWRLLREGRFQTALILGGVTIGVGVIVYITAIVNGLQANIIERTLSSQAHVVLRPADRLNQAALSAPDGVTPLADVRKRTQRENTIANWTPLLHEIRAHPRVTASAVMASGPGVAQQGGVRKSVSLMGIELDDYQTVVRLDNKLRSGQLQLAAGEALIGVELAADLGLSPGSRLRLQSASGEQISVRVAATLDFGLKDLNRRWVLMPLRDAQNLLGYRLDITEIYVRTDQLFERAGGVGGAASARNRHSARHGHPGLADFGGVFIARRHCRPGGRAIWHRAGRRAGAGLYPDCPHRRRWAAVSGGAGQRAVHQHGADCLCGGLIVGADAGVARRAAGPGGGDSWLM